MAGHGGAGEVAIYAVAGGGNLRIEAGDVADVDEGMTLGKGDIAWLKKTSIDRSSRTFI